MPSLAFVAVACLLLGTTFAFISNYARKKGERKGRRREEKRGGLDHVLHQ
jgi:hypothetical protein